MRNPRKIRARRANCVVTGSVEIAGTGQTGGVTVGANQTTCWKDWKCSS